MNYWPRLVLYSVALGVVVGILGILIWDLHGWRLTLLALAVSAPILWRISRPEPRP